MSEKQVAKFYVDCDSICKVLKNIQSHIGYIHQIRAKNAIGRCDG